MMGMGMLDSIFGGGDDASDASIRGSETAAQAKQGAVNYLKAADALPREYREKAIRGYGDIYTDDTGEAQQAAIDKAIASPLYQKIMGGQEAGEESIMRNAAMTGGLRSGNTQHAMYDYNTQLENSALLESYNQQLGGLQQLMGLPSLAPMIAQGMGDVGQIRGQGQIAAGQAQATGSQNQFGNMLGMGQLGLAAYNAFSDRRLKSKITPIGEHKGFKFYKWVWNSLAEKIGCSGKTVGVMADEIWPTHPECVSLKDGFMMVNYSRLGILPYPEGA